MNQQFRRFYRIAGVLAAILFLTGTAWGAPNISSPPANTTVNQDEFYEFVPTVQGAVAPLTFAITNKPDWATFSETTGSLSGTPGNADVGQSTGIIITVEDANQETDSTSPFAVEVLNVNDPPTVDITALPTTVEEDANYSGQVDADDPDTGDTLTYELSNNPSWLSINGDGLITGTPRNEDVGTYESIVVIVKDASNVSSFAFFNLTVTNTNDAPSISGTPATSVNEDSAYSFTPTASDIDEEAGVPQTLTFSVTPDPATNWYSFNTTTGALTGTPTNDDIGTISNIQISVSDGTATTNLPSFSITVVNTNDPPTITGTPAVLVDEDAAYSFTPTASDEDPGNTTFTYFIANKPSWANFSTTDGSLTGTPVNEDVGAYEDISISVSDGNGGIASLAPFTILVQNTNDPPVISGTPPTSATEDMMYSFTPTVTDPDAGDTKTFSITWDGSQTKPAEADWLSFSTGTLSGTPTNDDVGNTVQNIVITVQDSQSVASALAPFNIEVRNVNNPPTISGTPPTTVDQDDTYTFPITLNDVDNAVEELSVTFTTGLDNSGALPTWLTFNDETDTLGGTPTNADVGTIENIVATVSDGSAQASLPGFNLTVNNLNDLPEFTATPPSTVVIKEDTPYSFTFEATDPDTIHGQTLSFSLTAPQLAWLSINSQTGVLSGTPTSSDVDPAGKSATVTVSDTFSPAGTAQFQFTVKVTDDGSDAPVFTATPPNPLVVEEADPAGPLFTVTATDTDIGDQVRFSISGNPGWLFLDPQSGVLRNLRTLTNDDVGTTNNVTIQAIDKFGNTDTFSFNVVVNNVNNPPSIDVVSPLTITIDEETAFNLTDYASDPDLLVQANPPEVLSYSLSMDAPTWVVLNPTTGAVSGVPPVNFALGTPGYTPPSFTVTVKDRANATATLTVNIVVNNLNDPPVISGTPPGAIINQGFTFTPTVFDADGDDTSGKFRIENQPAWTTFDPATGALTGTPTQTGSFNGVRIIANDGKVDSQPLTFDIVVISDSVIEPGDVDGNGIVELNDAILALKVLSGVSASDPVFVEADVNNDGKIGIEEVIFILQAVGTI